ncbi:MAG: TonB-dependent receptor plug domain-containing protein, partial [Ginsengibacter sp.]
MRYVFTLGLLLLFTAFSNISFAQNKITVKGVVKEKSGANKAGVTISTGKPLKSIGSTNENGAFDVSVEAGSTLVFTHIGFTKTERKVSASTSNLTIVMAETDNSMETVVVQGFTKKTRETSTGASTIISGKSIQDVPVSNVMELLQGRVAGLNIQNNTGSPGGMGTINLRGVSSASVGADGFISPTSPLFVIDGVPVDVNTNYEYGFQGGGPGISPLALIPREDIEQMEFLKDAASTS